VLSVYRESGDCLGEADALWSLGNVSRMQEAYAEAEALYQQALATYRESGDRLGEANALARLGQVKRQQEAYAEPEQLYSAAFAIYASIDDKYSQGATLLLLAEVYSDLGDQEKARSLACQAEELLAAFPQLFQKGEHVM
jgi:tetratricopeptide (TPR) repeat protein